jgi:glycerol-3-phosphate acyltransferase PlsY
MTTFLLPLVSYLLGSVPCGLLAGKALKGVDLRTVGSGNIGTANAFRELGKVGGSLTLAGDLAKGLLPVMLVTQGPLAATGGPLSVALWQVGIGMCAVLGHNNSVFLGFKGGKGIATTLGVVLALNWKASLACVGVWGAMVAMTGYSSLGSLCGAAALPMAMYAFTPHETPEQKQAVAVYVGFAVVAAILAFYKHRKNLKALRDGTERKLFKR